jgi:hypothetical protein
MAALRVHRRFGSHLLSRSALVPQPSSTFNIRSLLPAEAIDILTSNRVFQKYPEHPLVEKTVTIFIEL